MPSKQKNLDETGKPKVRPRHFQWDADAIFEMFERKETTDYHGKFGGLDGLCRTLQVDKERGIASASLPQRYEQFGKNELDRKPPVTFLETLIDALGDDLIRILLVAAMISVIFGMTLPDPHSGVVQRDSGWIKGTALILSCAVVVLISAVNNYQKAKRFEELELAQSVKNVTVKRDGQDIEISSDEIAVGDILVLTTGMELPCDGIYLRGTNIKSNESPITGEPDLIEKDELHPFFISGTSVEEGSGEMLVVAIGMDSFQGRMKNMKDDEKAKGKKKEGAGTAEGGEAPEGQKNKEDGGEKNKEEGGNGGKDDDDDDDDKKSDDDDEDEQDQTPLQEHLSALAEKVGKIGLGLALFVLVALSIKEIILITTEGKTASPASFLSFIIIAITLIAVAIPEGLPLAVTISLAYSMKAMMEDNCMVRILASCETMGAATAICSDKTGTLTTNQMTVVQGYLFETEFIIDGYGCNARHGGVKVCSRDSFDKSIISPANSELFCRALSVNSTAAQVKNREGNIVWSGNKTEIGLLGICNHFGYDYKSFRKNLVEKDNYFRFDFSSTTKRMTSLVKDPELGGLVAFVKGASEIVAAKCSRFLSKTGEVVPLDGVQRAQIDTIIEDMASQGNRTISLAYSVLAGQTEFPHEHPDLDDLIFLGVLGVQDPIRQEVPAAVANCASAGLVVRMVTGDNATTARAIGKKCGIFNEASDVCLEGKDFREMYRTNPEALVQLLPRVRILARSSPMDKFILVKLLQDPDGLCDVVGVTGDGTNDAPALKLADVGFAMQSGTDIAKGSADMVLMDDNFATVVTAIMWGRAVNDNIKKFIQYQLAINSAGVLLTVVGSLASKSSKEPLAAVQLMWLNLIMDSLAALSLATEKPEEACLHRDPVYKLAPLINNRMWSFIGLHGTFQFTMVMIMLFLGHNWFGTIEYEGTCHANLDKTFVNGSYTSPVTRFCAERCTSSGGSLNTETWVCQQGYLHSTLIFNAFIFCQIFNVLNARKLYGEWNPFEGLWDRSRLLIGVYTFVVGLQAIAVEFFGRFMSVTSLPWQWWLITIAIGSIELPLGFLIRLLPIKNFKPDAAAEKTARERERQLLAEKAKDSQNQPMLIRRDSSLRRRNSITNKNALSGNRHDAANNNNQNSDDFEMRQPRKAAQEEYQAGQGSTTTTTSGGN